MQKPLRAVEHTQDRMELRWDRQLARSVRRLFTQRQGQTMGGERRNQRRGTSSSATSA